MNEGKGVSPLGNYFGEEAPGERSCRYTLVLEEQQEGSVHEGSW